MVEHFLCDRFLSFLIASCLSSGVSVVFNSLTTSTGTSRQPPSPREGAVHSEPVRTPRTSATRRFSSTRRASPGESQKEQETKKQALLGFVQIHLGPNPKFQSSRVPKFQNSKGPKFQSSKVPKFQSSKVPEFQTLTTLSTATTPRCLGNDGGAIGHMFSLL